MLLQYKQREKKKFRAPQSMKIKFRSELEQCHCQVS